MTYDRNPYDDDRGQNNGPDLPNWMIDLCFWTGVIALLCGIIFLFGVAFLHPDPDFRIGGSFALLALGLIVVALQKRVPGPIGYPGATGAVGCRGEPGKDASSTLVDQLVECLYGSRISGMGFEDRSSARRIAAAVHFVEKQQWNLAHPSPPQPAAHPGPGKGRPSRPGGKRK